MQYQKLQNFKKFFSKIIKLGSIDSKKILLKKEKKSLSKIPNKDLKSIFHCDIFSYRVCKRNYDTISGKVYNPLDKSHNM